MKKFTSFLLAALMSVVLAVPAFASDGEQESRGQGMQNSRSNSERGEKRFEMRKDRRNDHKKAVKQLDATQLACVAAAVEKRETAVSAAVTAFVSSVNTAYSTRHTSLTAAWLMTDATARNQAVKDAWKIFKSSMKGANKTQNSARHDAWKTFKDSAKTCGATGESMESEGADKM